MFFKYTNTKYRRGIMEENLLPRTFQACPLCGGELEYGIMAKCRYCHEEFIYHFGYKVWKNPNILDIGYLDPESSTLSNLFPHPLQLDDGITYGSVEAFLRGLCWNGKRKVLREEIAPLSGMDAWRIRFILPDWREKQVLYFDGEEYERESDKYQQLLEYVYDNLRMQSELFRLALEKYKLRLIMHTMGTLDPKNTLLTVKEYMRMLNREIVKL